MASEETILVTGGCGYIGSHVTRQLSEAGRKVVVLDNLSTGFRDALIHGETLVTADVGDEATLAKIFDQNRISTVMHFAASIVVPESVSEPLKYYENNTVNFFKLMKVAARAGVRNVIFSSTAAVYGEGAKTPVDESSPTEPTNPYGRSKLMDEWILGDVARSTGMRYVALRYFNVAGADLKVRMGQRSANATHLIKVACEAVVGKRAKLHVFGTDYPTPDGTCIRDYIHVEDLAAAHLSSMAHLEGGGPSATLNCGYGRGHSVKEVIDAVRRASGSDLPCENVARRPGDVSKLVADVTAIKRMLPWKPKHEDLDVIVGSALEWERKIRSR